MKKIAVHAIALATVLAAGAVDLAGQSGAHAASRDVQVRQATRYYTIRGRSPAEFASSMSANGPFSGQHRRRVWATASRTMRYQLESQRVNGTCRVKRARVFMTIDYTMPRLRSRVSSRARTRWNQMYKILNTHEKVHGRYYRQLATQTQSALRGMRPSRSCAALDIKAQRIVKRLSARNQALNDRFDRTDKRNYRRMERIYAFNQ